MSEPVKLGPYRVRDYRYRSIKDFIKDFEDDEIIHAHWCGPVEHTKPFPILLCSRCRNDGSDGSFEIETTKENYYAYRLIRRLAWE
jgi:hypothetical protein